MANPFKMAKQAMGMRTEMKQMQDTLAKIDVDYTAGGGKVKVVACADMTIRSIEIDPRSIDPEKAGRLTELLVAGVNGALKAAKKRAAGEMSKMSGSLGNLFGS